MKVLKMMVMFFMIVISVPAIAGIDTDDLSKFNQLTDSQKAEIIKQVENLSSQGSSGVTAEVVQEKMKAWGEIGAGIGVMLVNTARELGIAANEFSQTPLGKLAVTVGLLYMFGGKLLGILVWIVCWFIFLPAIWRSYKMHAFTEKVEYKITDRKLFWLFPIYEKTVTRSQNNISDGEYMTHLLTGAVFAVTGILCLINF